MMYVEGEDRSAALVAAMMGVILFYILLQLLITAGFSWAGMKEEVQLTFNAWERRFYAFCADKRQVGFTLIELGTVLVIIALLVGGVLVGQDLIKAATIRAVMSDVEQITTAVYTFQSKYECLPGDCANATQFFGHGTCNGAAEIGTATCNGNGDGQITGSGYGGCCDGYEARYFWQHLQNAGLLKSTISSPGFQTGFGGNQGIAGVNVPQSSWSATSLYEVKSNIMMQNWNQGGRIVVPTALYYGNAIVFGPNEDSTGVMDWYTPHLTQQQAQMIDTKYDDGFANSGTIVGLSPAPNGCYNTTLTQPTPYMLTGGYGYCELVFPRRF